MRVFHTSPWIPAEWIAAHGLEPRGIWLADKLRLEAAPLSAGVCAFAEAMRRLTVDEPKSVMVFTTACDQIRRSHDGLPAADRRRSFLFNVPATWQTPTATAIYRAELERLSHFLCTVGGHAPSTEILKRELARRGVAREQLLDAASTGSGRAFAEAMAQFHWDGTFKLPAPSHATTNGVPIAIIGGPLCRSQWHLFNTIEEAGGRVALNATEPGERSLWPKTDWDDATETPLDLLVRACFTHLVEAFQRPNTRLYTWLQPRLTERGVRGIVLWAYTSCDLWRAEARTLRGRCGLPVLLLEPDEARQSSPRDTSRIEAFLEALQ